MIAATRSKIDARLLYGFFSRLGRRRNWKTNDVRTKEGTRNANGNDIPRCTGWRGLVQSLEEGTREPP